METGYAELPPESGSWKDLVAQTPLDEASRPIDTLTLFQSEIDKVPRLTAEEEVELAKQIEAGVFAQEKLDAQWQEGISPLDPELRRDLGILARQGKQAYDRMLAANQRLVMDQARRMLGRGLDLLDLVGEGNIGLVRAVQKFDFTKGVKFGTYAMPWIKQKMTQGIVEQARTVRLPEDVYKTVRNLTSVENALRDNLGRSPTDKELAEAAAMPVDKVADLRPWTRPVRRLEELVAVYDDGSEATLGEHVSDHQDSHEDATDRELDSTALRAILDEGLGILDERSRWMLRRHLGFDGEPENLTEIGKHEHINLTSSRVGKIVTKSLVRLRTEYGSRLEPFLD